MFRKPSPSLVISLLALFIALGGAGYSATGGTFILGQFNSAVTPTVLSTPVNGRSLWIGNASTGASATALALTVAPGKPPMIVNSAVKVTNLNADKLDGLDSAAFARSTSEGWHYIGDPGEPAFENSWVNANSNPVHADASFPHAAYRKDANGVVHLRGTVKFGTINTAIFTLPAAYCPHFFKLLPATSFGAHGQLLVNPDCRVVAEFGSTSEFSLDGASFQPVGLDELDAALP